MAHERDYAAEYRRRRASLRRRVETPTEAERRRVRQRERYASSAHTLRVSGYGHGVTVTCLSCMFETGTVGAVTLAELASMQSEHRRSVRGS